MIGMQHIEIWNSRCVFKLNLERKISVIRGRSATGKTTLVNMIQSYDKFGPSSGITLHAPKRCMVLSAGNWEVLLDQVYDSIIFIDDGQSFISSPDFTRAVLDSDNTYVIITRRDLPHLPIEIDAVYSLRDRLNSQSKKTVHTLHRMYPHPPALK